MEEKEDSKFYVVLYSRKKGWLISLPWIRAHGNPDAMLSRPRWGFASGEKIGWLRHWMIYTGKGTLDINHPGEMITEESLDQFKELVKRHVDFMGTTYTYWSGTRTTYRKNHPNKKKIEHVWIPDHKHDGDERAVSMGLGSDIYEVMKFMEEWRQDMRKDPDL